MTSKHALALVKLVFFLLFAVQVVHASIDVYEFSSEDKRERYHALTKELRCPKCQNQDIADSNAPIAKDMRREVHRLVETGASEGDVVAYMVERFGEFVMYTPTLDQRTYALWYGPVVVLALGLLIVIITASRARKNRQVNSTEQQGQAQSSFESVADSNSPMQAQSTREPSSQAALVQALLDEQNQQNETAGSQAELDKLDKGK